MSQSGYTPWVVTAGEIPTTAYWNILGANDASFNTGNGFNDNILQSRHYGVGSIPTSALQANTVASGVATSTGEIGYTAGVWTDVPTVQVTITTSVANQNVTVFSSVQTYTGGVTVFRYTLDGTAVGRTSQYKTAINDATTGSFLYFDFFTIASVGSHTIKLQANAGASTLRIINGEGAGRIVALLS